MIVVVPHWGVEYTDRITRAQARLAPALLRAGADVVLGGHSHWAGPVGISDGKLAVYSIGDLVFDLIHDARTQQGMLVELTFAQAARPGDPPPDPDPRQRPAQPAHRSRAAGARS